MYIQPADLVTSFLFRNCNRASPISIYSTLSACTCAVSLCLINSFCNKLCTYIHMCSVVTVCVPQIVDAVPWYVVTWICFQWTSFMVPPVAVPLCLHVYCQYLSACVQYTVWCYDYYMPWLFVFLPMPCCSQVPGVYEALGHVWSHAGLEPGHQDLPLNWEGTAKGNPPWCARWAQPVCMPKVSLSGTLSVVMGSVHVLRSHNASIPAITMLCFNWSQIPLLRLVPSSSRLYHSLQDLTTVCTVLVWPSTESNRCVV